MGAVGTNTQAAETHSSALNTRANRVNGVLISHYFNIEHPPAPIAAANFARDICRITRNYVTILRRSADQITQLHNRRVEEDVEASRQISPE